jgi:hypothetical protein
MRFKNVGPNLVRWKMERFDWQLGDGPILVALYLTKQGTLGPGDEFVFEGTDRKDVDLGQEVTGQLSFSCLYGPPQNPGAFRTMETWSFAINPDGQGGFTHHVYKARKSDEPA